MVGSSSCCCPSDRQPSCSALVLLSSPSLQPHPSLSPPPAARRSHGQSTAVDHRWLQPQSSGCRADGGNALHLHRPVTDWAMTPSTAAAAARTAVVPPPVLPMPHLPLVHGFAAAATCSALFVCLQAAARPPRLARSAATSKSSWPVGLDCARNVCHMLQCGPQMCGSSAGHQMASCRHSWGMHDQVAMACPPRWQTQPSAPRCVLTTPWIDLSSPVLLTTSPVLLSTLAATSSWSL